MNESMHCIAGWDELRAEIRANFSEARVLCYINPMVSESGDKPNKRRPTTYLVHTRITNSAAEHAPQKHACVQSPVHL